MDWLQWLTASGAVCALGLALATWLRTRPAMKLAQTQADGPLWARIEKLEAELADLRHDLANETMSFDSFLLIAETNPERLSDLIPRVREERLRHKERKALRVGARQGQRIAAAENGGDVG